MKKLRTIKPIPGIPVGTVLEWNTATDSYLVNTPRNGPTRNGSTLAMQEDILAGFVEEIKEPEGFWWMDYTGDVRSGFPNGVPDWLRFRTKDSAEKFANALKEYKIHESSKAWLSEIDGRISFHDTERSAIVWKIMNALNDRVK